MLALVPHRQFVSLLRLLAVVVILLGGLLPFAGVANAAGLRILIVSTGKESQQLGTEINNNFLKEFQNNAPAGSNVVTDTIELDNQVAASPDFFSGYDIVVVDAVFDTINEKNRAAISDAVLMKKSNAFIFFVDSCGGCSPANASWFLELIKSNAKFTPGQGAEVDSVKEFPLNTASPYAVSFQGLQSIYGTHYKPYTDVPVDNILYKQNAAALTPPTGNAYGLLLPLGEAKGACTFATTDSSMFDPTYYSKDENKKNENKVAPAFYAAVQGSCFAAVKETADLGITIAASPNQVTANSQVTYTVTVSNAGPQDATNVRVALTLPAGLTFNSSKGCAEDPNGSATCSLDAIKVNQSKQFSVQVASASATAGSTLTTNVEVSSDVADPSLINNTAAASTSANIQPTLPAKPILVSDHGDVHIRTPDGLVYDFQEVGEVVLTQSTSGDVMVQARQETYAKNPRVSINTAVALLVGGDKLEFYLKPERRFYINDLLTDLPSTDLQLPKGGSINPSGDASRPDFTILWPDGNTGARVVLFSDSHMDIGIARLNGSLTYAGVLGNLDNNPQNDMQLRNGDQLTPPTSFDQLRSFGDSWRVSANESLFRDAVPSTETAIPTEAVTAAPTTEAVTPEAPLTLLDLDPAARTEAKQTCQSANISGQLALDNCTYDVAATGDKIFVESAKTFEESVKDLPPSANANVPAVELPTAPAAEPTTAATPAAEPTTAAAPAAEPAFLGGLLMNPIILLVLGALVVIVIFVVVRRR